MMMVAAAAAVAARCSELVGIHLQGSGQMVEALQRELRKVSVLDLEMGLGCFQLEEVQKRIEVQIRLVEGMDLNEVQAELIPWVVEGQKAVAEIVLLSVMMMMVAVGARNQKQIEDQNYLLVVVAWNRMEIADRS
jgi:hypothetical protein